MIGRILALYCNTHTDCKQQHFLTRKQTQNPPIKPSFNPASPYSGCFFSDIFFSKLKRQQCSLVNVRPVWSPRFFGPALTFCWAKNKVHIVHTESFAALIPRKWNFTPSPKQTRPHISLHYLNVLIEYKKPYQVDMRKSKIHECNHEKTALCKLFCLLTSHSWGSSGSTQLKKVSHLTREIRSAQSKSSTLITHIQYITQQYIHHFEILFLKPTPFHPVK